MHKETTIKHWSHHLHDAMLTILRHISEHIHSRHFWVGVVLTLLLVGITTLLFLLAQSAPFVYPHEIPYAPYGI